MASVERRWSPDGFSPGSSTSGDLERKSYGISSKKTFFFGGTDFIIGPRIAPIPERLKNDEIYQGDDSGAAILEKQLASEEGQAIQYRTCSWQKTAALLFSQFIALPAMSFPFAYSQLGLGLGLAVTAVAAVVSFYTSLIIWEFCLRHPEARDVCDIGQMIFGGKEWMWWVIAVVFVLNNIFAQGFSVLSGAQYLNTMTDNDIIGGCRTVEFAIILTIACWLASLPRTFSLVSKLGTISALFTFAGYIVTVTFAAKQPSPAGYDPVGKGEPFLLIQLPASTTFSQGLTAVLTISVTIFGQIAVPSFVAEMREPREFPKSLLVSVVAELVVFSVVGATIYAFTGQQYITSPAFGALQSVYKKISFTFMVPTILFVGALYASFTARFVFFRIFRDSKHTTGHTLVGWLSWSSILLVSWISAFLIAEVVPFFSALLSLSGALFMSWYGFIFWGVACLRMRSVDRKVGRCNAPIYDFFLVTANSGLILAGIFCLTAGTYASIDVIEEAFRDGQVQGVFSCKTNGI